MGLFKGAAILVGAAVLALFLLVAVGRWKWAGLTQDLIARIEAARQAPQPARFDPPELEGLPPVVQRYFRAVLPVGAPIVAAISVDPKAAARRIGAARSRR